MHSAFAISIQSFLLRELRTLHAELDGYEDESMIWETPPGLPNSAGTLAMHLAGNLQHSVGTILGGGDYVRDRSSEFGDSGVGRDILHQQIRAAEDAVTTVLGTLTETSLSEPYPEPIRGVQIEVSELLIQLSVHLAYHLGQINYHRRIVTGNAAGFGALNSAELSTARPFESLLAE